MGETKSNGGIQIVSSAFWVEGILISLHILRMTHLEFYKQQIKKLYPNITDEEFNKKLEEFEADMEKQTRLKKDWVKVVPQVPNN